jgi:hypothetical protein
MDPSKKSATDGTEPSPAHDTPSEGVSRRHVVVGAAVGAAGAAAVLAGAAGSASAASKSSRAAGAASATGVAVGGSAEPLVLHVRDARTGEIDVYQGASQVTVHDPALAAQLYRIVR